MSQSKQFESEHSILIVDDDTEFLNGARRALVAHGIAAAGGFIVNLTKSGLFQIGLLSGFDWAGKGSQYKYEGKPWISVSFGTNFTK
jgi:hypothetical protein